MSDAKPDANITVERRKNLALRALIDAMLDRVREAQRSSLAWSAEERRSAERDLAAIMERVRQQATQPPAAQQITAKAASPAKAPARKKRGKSK